MQRFGHWMLGLMLAALLMTAGSALVVGPETDAADAPARAEQGPMLLCVEGVPVDDVLPVLLARHEERPVAPHTDREDRIVPCVVVADGNGWPVTGRTWTRTVYTVCPPEGMPG